MIKLIKSNWREAVALAVFVSFLLFGILALGDRAVSESSGASAAVSLLVSLAGGVTKFTACLALAWIGLAITFPEAAKYVFGEEFDGFWLRCPGYVKFYVALAAAGVLLIAAALCMASS